MIELTIKYIQIEATPTYHCCKCHKHRCGTSVTREYRGYFSPLGVSHLFDESQVGPSQMPVGWASFTRGRYACPDCIDKVQA